MEKNAGCFATDEDDHKMIIEAASPWKQLWDKKLAKYVDQKECNNKHLIILRFYQIYWPPTNDDWLTESPNQ